MLAFLNKHKSGIIGTLIFHFLVLNLFFVLKLSKTRNLESSAILIDFETEETNIEKKVEEAITKEVVLPEAINYTNYAYKINRLKQIEEKLYRDNDLPDNKNVSEEYMEEVIRKAVGEEIYEKVFSDKPEFKTNENNSKKIEQDTLTIKNKHIIYKGPSTLIYEIENRTGIKLPLPVYKCQGGGLVKLSIEVTQNGNVISASIKDYKETVADNCILEAAMRSALSSKFNPDIGATEVQKGTIIYTFISQ